MFTVDDVLNIDVNDNELDSYTGLFTTYYKSYAFNCVDSCEYIFISRSPKEDKDNGVKFMFRSYLDDGSCRDRSVSDVKGLLLSADFKLIAEDVFNEKVKEQCAELITKPQYPLSSKKFIGALIMYDLDQEFMVDMFAEYEDEYIHFYWDTTA
ncbi:MAG: hypothetical protein VX185_16670 [Pseudomonadota bacterium]|nr:hypothetical protein [Pseudomonadota bacterium]